MFVKSYKSMYYKSALLYKLKFVCYNIIDKLCERQIEYKNKRE